MVLITLFLGMMMRFVRLIFIVILFADAVIDGLQAELASEGAALILVRLKMLRLSFLS